MMWLPWTSQEMLFPEKLISLTYRSWFCMMKLDFILKGFIIIYFCMSWFIHIFFSVYSCIYAGKISPPILGGISFTLKSRINLRSFVGKIANYIHEVSSLIFLKLPFLYYFCHSQECHFSYLSLDHILFLNSFIEK